MSLIEQILQGIMLAPCFNDMTLVHMKDEESPFKLFYCPNEDNILIQVFTGTANAPAIRVECLRESSSLDGKVVLKLLEFLKWAGVDPLDDNFQWHHEMKETFFNLREECTRALEVTSNV